MNGSFKSSGLVSFTISQLRLGYLTKRKMIATTSILCKFFYVRLL